MEKFLQHLVAEIQSRQPAAVMKPKPPLDQLEDLLRRLLANRAAPVPVPAPVQEGPMVEWLQQRLVAELQSRRPVAVSSTEPMELRSYLSGQQTSRPQIRRRSVRRDRNVVGCFSCGKSGHSAARCPDLDDSFPFMLPGWRAESIPGGFVMIPPNEAVGLRSCLSGQQTSRPQIRRSTVRRDRNGAGCFSCGKSGHDANRCPDLDDSFPFMLPGWIADSIPGGFVMISPSEAAKRRRTENSD